MADVIGYARVSTSDQDMSEQHRRLKTEAGAIRVFEDVKSGRSIDRPGLRDMLEYVRPGDTVCVVRLDRLGRSMMDLLATIELFKANGVQFRSLEEAIDTGTATGEMIFHIFGAIAQFERRLISERTIDGVRAARARGKKFGRPPGDPETLESGIKLVEAGLSVKLAAEQLGIGRSTLYRAIQKEKDKDDHM